MNRVRTACAIIFFLIALNYTPADSFPVPATTSYVNVKTRGAKGDGVTDDTQILKSLLSGNIGMIYFPNGTYLVKDRLLCTYGGSARNMRVHGESRDGVVIRLADGTVGYQDTLNPKAVLSFESGFADQNFTNYVVDLTVDVGRNNPGAVALAYNCANIGAVSNVVLRSTDATKRGAIGLGLTYGGKNGPSLIRDLVVDGFDYGIRVGSDLHVMTFENITLRNQRRACIHNFGGMPLAMRKVTSSNSVPFAQGRFSLVLFDATLTNPTTTGTAFEMLAGATILRRVNVSGYRHIYGRDTTYTTRNINEFLSTPPVSLFPPPDPILFTIPIQDIPNPAYGDPASWTPSTTASTGTHQTIQAAIDAGATTVYVSQMHSVSGTIFIRNRVKRIIQLSGTHRLNMSGEVLSGARPLFVVKNNATNTPDTVVIENFEAQGAPKTIVDSSTNRAVVVKDMSAWTYEKHVRGGRVFFDNVTIVGIKLLGQQAFMRQINPERSQNPKVLNDGGNLWILGLKTEHAGTIIRTINGGRTEVAGGSVYPVDVIPVDQVMFEAINSHVSTAAIIPRNFVDSTRTYRNFVKETWQSTTRFYKSVPSFFCGGPPAPVAAQPKTFSNAQSRFVCRVMDHTLVVQSASGSSERILVLNPAGRIIAQGLASHDSPLSVSLSNHGKGAFIVKAVSSNGIHARKVVVDR